MRQCKVVTWLSILGVPFTEIHLPQQEDKTFRSVSRELLTWQLLWRVEQTLSYREGLRRFFQGATKYGGNSWQKPGWHLQRLNFCVAVAFSVWLETTAGTPLTMFSRGYLPCLHLRRDSWSSLLNSPGGTGDSEHKSSKWLGVKGSRSWGSVETVMNGRAFIMLSTSHIGGWSRVRRSTGRSTIFCSQTGRWRRRQHW